MVKIDMMHIASEKERNCGDGIKEKNYVEQIEYKKGIYEISLN